MEAMGLQGKGIAGAQVKEKQVAIKELSKHSNTLIIETQFERLAGFE